MRPGPHTQSFVKGRGKHGTTGGKGEVPGEIEVALIRDRGKGAK